MNEPKESRPGPFLECVPNFSEGSDEKKVQAIVAAMQVDGVRLLDWSMDKDHNRSVVTIAGPAQQVVEAAVRGAGKAAELIDLTRQQGAASQNWRGRRDSVCSLVGLLAGAVCDAGAAGGHGDLEAARDPRVFLRGGGSEAWTGRCWKMSAEGSLRVCGMQLGRKRRVGLTLGDRICTPRRGLPRWEPENS